MILMVTMMRRVKKHHPPGSYLFAPAVNKGSKNGLGRPVQVMVTFRNTKGHAGRDGLDRDVNRIPADGNPTPCVGRAGKKLCCAPFP